MNDMMKDKNQSSEVSQIRVHNPCFTQIGHMIYQTVFDRCRVLWNWFSCNIIISFSFYCPVDDWRFYTEASETVLHNNRGQIAAAHSIKMLEICFYTSFSLSLKNICLIIHEIIFPTNDDNHTESVFGLQKYIFDLWSVFFRAHTHWEIKICFL